MHNAILQSYPSPPLRVKPNRRALFIHATSAVLALFSLQPTLASASGSTTPAVTQANIQQTICVPGYTRKVRPSSSYTNSLKKLLLRRTGQPLSAIHDYELDHQIPLALGGHPTDHVNLVLQAWGGETGAHRKDQLELKLQCLVCTERLPLTEAQTAIATNWPAAYRQYAAVQCHRSRQRLRRH